MLQSYICKNITMDTPKQVYLWLFQTPSRVICATPEICLFTLSAQYCFKKWVFPALQVFSTLSFHRLYTLLQKIQVHLSFLLSLHRASHPEPQRCLPCLDFVCPHFDKSRAAPLILKVLVGTYTRANEHTAWPFLSFLSDLLMVFFNRKDEIFVKQRKSLKYHVNSPSNFLRFILKLLFLKKQKKKPAKRNWQHFPLGIYFSVSPPNLPPHQSAQISLCRSLGQGSCFGTALRV